MAENTTEARDPLSAVLDRFAGKPSEKPKRPGRPRKRTEAYLRSLLAEHERVRVWFASRFGRAAGLRP